jgi:nucleoid-associated protein YgaU
VVDSAISLGQSCANKQVDIMGFFSFVADAGKKLFGGGKPEGAEQHAEALKKELESHKLGTQDIEVVVEGDTAIIKGAVADQSIFEKAVLAVGNTLGISNVKTDGVTISAADVPDAPADPRFHTVAKGDTLWAVATKEYGNGSKYTAIFEANRPMLSDPDKIYPGQVLRIPELD